MQISVVHCHRECKCAFCPELIQSGEPMAVGRYQKFREGWFGMKRWHLKCWYDQALIHLDKNPYIAAHKGRKALELDDEAKKARFSLLRRRASVMQRINRIMSKDNLASGFTSIEIERLSHLSEMLEGIKTSIAEVGGVPKSWQ